MNSMGNLRQFKTGRLWLLAMAVLTLLMPFTIVAQSHHAAAAENRTHMTTSVSECIGQCTNMQQAPLHTGSLAVVDKEQQRDPAQALGYWIFLQPFSISALYLLLPTILLFTAYRDPMILRSTQLRF